jgi:hypothetical protein
MDAFKSQIHSLISSGFSTIAIAEALEVDIAVVRAVAGTADENDRADMLGVIKSIALDKGARPADRLKAAIYMHEETHGRNEKRSNNVLTVAPVIEIATRLAAARNRALPARSRVIDVSAIQDQ